MPPISVKNASVFVNSKLLGTATSIRISRGVANRQAAARIAGEIIPITNAELNDYVNRKFAEMVAASITKPVAWGNQNAATSF